MMGLTGMTVFDGLCAIASCAMIMGFLPEDRRMWWWSVPVFLFFTPIYTRTVMDGLTEPLFGLVAVLIVLLLRRGRYSAAMVLLSLMPFIRPEYVVFAPLALGYAILKKAWRALPWALTGIAIYSILSGLLTGRPFAFFTEPTYLGNAFYGRGSGWLFYENIDSIYGLPLKRAIGLSIPAFGVLVWREGGRRRMHLTVAALTLLPAFGIFLLHSYAWWRGGMGSLGLLRVMATTVPLLVMFVVYSLSACWKLVVPDRGWTRALFAVALFIYGNTAYHELRHRVQFPIPDAATAKYERDAADFVNARRLPGQRVVVLDPYIGMLCGLDPWDADESLPLSDIASLTPRDLHAGDWIVWDAHFAANEGHIPLDSLLYDDRFHPEAVFEPSTPFLGLGGIPYAVHVFQWADRR
jgi:hypothetical protein